MSCLINNQIYKENNIFSELKHFTNESYKNPNDRLNTHYLQASVLTIQYEIFDYFLRGRHTFCRGVCVSAIEFKTETSTSVSNYLQFH